MKKRNFPLYKIFVYVALITLAISIIVPIVWVFDASIFIGQVKHLEFDLIRNQSH